MLDIKFVRANPDAVKENIKKKFQDEKLVLVDEVLEFDQQYREAKTKADSLRGERNALSKQIGGLMAQGKKDEADGKAGSSGNRAGSQDQGENDGHSSDDRSLCADR